jgi:hypothetical protein
MLDLDNQELAASQVVMEDTFFPEHLMSLYNEMVAEAGEPPELMGVGAGAGGGYGHTNELRTMNYRKAMASPDRHLWEEAIRQEYLKFVKFGVSEVIPLGELPSGKKLITCAWAIKLSRETDNVVRVQMLADSSRSMVNTTSPTAYHHPYLIL